MNQTEIATRLCRSAAHITAVTKDNTCFGSLEKISDGQFEAIAGIDKLTFKRIVESSGRDWVHAFKANYLHNKKIEDQRLAKMFGLG